MNILNICDSDEFDIVAYQALYTAVYFKKIGHNAVVMCPKSSKLYSECLRHHLAAVPLTFSARLGFFEGKGYDITHFYNPASLTALLLKKAVASSKVFITQLKLGNQGTFAKLAGFEPYVDKFVAASNSAKEDFLRAGIDQRKVFMVPPAIKIGRWESAMLIKPAMFLKRPYKVGTVSMDPTLKEQELFLKVAIKVLTKLPDTNFMIVGIKDERIREMARSLGVSHKVDILWARNDIPEIMAMLHIFVKTSWRDGLSMSLIEAQASGVACVLPRLRGLSDFTLHEHNGLLVEPRSVESYSDAIETLILNPPACHKMSRIAFDYISDNMSLPVVGNLLLRLYEEALEV
ncbi:MAG: glycosyltransferase family 4 protein [Elusimicrobia bacterium]|nr:glycosyltransferase family 4 protein [Elusimicrobiota bacterium]